MATPPNPQATVEVAGQPEVTVVIPTRDRWPLLARALGCALGQRGVSVEVVVIDDGSKDETPARLAERAGEKRLRVVRNEHSCGVAAARNAGITMARGAWVAFLDDDDLWAPEKLRLQLAVAVATEASFVYARAVEVDEHLRPLATMYSPDPETLPRRLLAGNVLPTPSAVAARTDLVRRVGGFDEQLRVCADWDLWLRLSQAGTGAECSQVLTAYVRHATSMLTTEAERVRPEFEHIRDKHAPAARAAGVEFGNLWLDRWNATLDLTAGRRWAAARGYLRAAWTNRDLGSLAHAIGVSLGPRAHARMRALKSRRTEVPVWLTSYAEGNTVPAP